MEVAIGIILQTLLLHLNGKILVHNRKVTISEFVFLTVVAVIMVLMYNYLNFFTSIVMILNILIINYLKYHKLVLAVGVTSYATIILVLSDHLATIMEVYVLQINQTHINYTYVFAHLGIQIILSVLISYWVANMIKRVEKKLGLDIVHNIFVAVLGLATMIVYYTSIYLGFFLGNAFPLIQLNLMFFIGYLVITLFIFFFYMHALKNKYEVEQKEIEYESMNRYTEAMEKQYHEVRKFRHDYKNILSSIDDYLLENDYEGLKIYFLHKIKPSSEMIDRNNFKLNDLRNIKIRELKSILSFKLISAQEAGIDIVIEVTGQIKVVPTDTIILVRLIGIILDNAVEEVQFLGKGQIAVSLFEDFHSVQIIVQNTCRENIPKIHQLKKEGFSTKGENRGLGLSNMSEMINQTANLLLETTTEPRLFIQRLIIQKERR
ncbi:sensory histidine kinase DcuS [Listeria grayi]|uniref:Sensor histidine kinase-, DNA gyrase B-, and HSP90-like ATPase family protein n=1 Tax=Listeria grayi FSL F6-1183 TaxID=1265827 RepID=A0A829R9L9_LISGR|nr:GHKL domain-containing protein [Listeria grayi]EUJ30434.1 sensor histidine kinase-, DNA gyrase B-, and HSP90-like ATPase family protein [Listeria grayi FSL F6-1183]VEI31266.1 sensory histidine kinase DcuS [Listeria grayi]